MMISPLVSLLIISISNRNDKGKDKTNENIFAYFKKLIILIFSIFFFINIVAKNDATIMAPAMIVSAVS